MIDKKITYYIAGALLCFLLGFLWAALRYEYLVIRTSITRMSTTKTFTSEPVTIQCYFIKHGKIFSEKTQILASSDKLKTVQHVINAWLQVIQDELVMNKHVLLSYCACDSSEARLYVSFDRNPFDKQMSVVAKLNILESLLKTMHHAHLGYRTVFFMINGSVLIDQHLDFSHEWCIADYEHHV